MQCATCKYATAAAQLDQAVVIPDDRSIRSGSEVPYWSI
jgi:hypothetical protein